MTFDDISKFSIGVIAIGVLYKLLQPLIAALIASQVKFTENLGQFSSSLQTLVSTVAEMRADLRAHQQEDGSTAGKLLDGAGCRYAPPAPPVVIKP